MDFERAGLEAAPAHELYRRLLGDLEQDLGGRSRLQIVPDADLHALAFDALPMDREGQTYAIDRFRVVLLPSLALREWQPPELAPQMRVLAVGSDEVPGTRTRTTSIRSTPI